MVHRLHIVLALLAFGYGAWGGLGTTKKDTLQLIQEQLDRLRQMGVASREVDTLEESLSEKIRKILKSKRTAERQAQNKADGKTESDIEWEIEDDIPQKLSTHDLIEALDYLEERGKSRSLGLKDLHGLLGAVDLKVEMIQRGAAADEMEAISEDRINTKLDEFSEKEKRSPIRLSANTKKALKRAISKSLRKKLRLGEIGKLTASDLKKIFDPKNGIVEKLSPEVKKQLLGAIRVKQNQDFGSKYFAIAQKERDSDRQFMLDRYEEAANPNRVENGGDRPSPTPLRSGGARGTSGDKKASDSKGHPDSKEKKGKRFATDNSAEGSSDKTKSQQKRKPNKDLADTIKEIVKGMTAPKEPPLGDAIKVVPENNTNRLRPQLELGRNPFQRPELGKDVDESIIKQQPRRIRRKNRTPPVREQPLVDGFGLPIKAAYQDANKISSFNCGATPVEQICQSRESSSTSAGGQTDEKGRSSQSRSAGKNKAYLITAAHCVVRQADATGTLFETPDSLFVHGFGNLSQSQFRVTLPYKDDVAIIEITSDKCLADEKILPFAKSSVASPTNFFHEGRDLNVGTMRPGHVLADMGRSLDLATVDAGVFQGDSGYPGWFYDPATGKPALMAVTSSVLEVNEAMAFFVTGARDMNWAKNAIEALKSNPDVPLNKIVRRQRNNDKIQLGGVPAHLL